MKKLLLFMLLVMAIPTMMAGEDVTIDGIKYDLVTKAKMATVIAGDELYTGDVEIPPTVTYNNVIYNVTSIGESAFNQCTGLTSVTIPESVTSIGNSAFSGCSGLTSVHISDIAAWCNISFGNDYSNPLFYAHHLYLNGEEIKDDLVIPEGVTRIVGFQCCTSLTSITIPNSVTSIGERAFSGCSGLTSVTIGNSVTSIGNYAFSSCSGLTSVTIPNSVTSIGESAFSGCSGLTTVTIPNSVTSIGNYAFSGCSGLTSVDIPNSVTSIGKYAFAGCSGLTSVTIPNSVTRIGGNAFSDCSGLTSVTVSDNVKLIREGAFSGCGNLKSIEIGNNVTIDYNAFKDCRNLETLISGNIVTMAGINENCTTPLIHYVKIDDLSKFCKEGFLFDRGNYNTGPLAPVFSIGYNLERHVLLNGEEITDICIPEDVTILNSGHFFCWIGLTSVTIGNSVTSIGNYAFYNCSGLTTVTIPNSVTSIGRYAFDGCSGLTSVTIPESVTSIGDRAFQGCSGLTSVTIPNSVTSIGKYAFFGCSDISSLDIGSGVQSIDGSAFANCEDLEVVTCHATSVPTTNSNAFDGSLVEWVKLIVPDEAYDAYSTTAPWSNFGTKLKLSEATMVAAKSYTREYGDDNPAFEYTCGVVLDGTPEITCAATATSAPGTYPITISQGTVTNTGLVFVDGTLTVTKAPLTVTAQSYTITEGDDLPTFEVECTGLKNGETADVLNPVITCTATNSNTPGVYPITVTITTDNYEVTNEAGTLTIVPTEAVITISSAGMATYCSPYDLDFSGVKNLKAYIISGYDWANKKVFATRVYDVPAGTGLYLVAPEGEYHVNIGSTSCYYINMLVGTTSSITLEPTDGDVTNLILTGTSPQNASFKTLAASRTFGANKAYLQIPTSVLSSSANAVGIIFDDETDGIESISGMGHANGDWFTVDGRRLNSRPAQKGVYILNGNKIVIK